MTARQSSRQEAPSVVVLLVDDYEDNRDLYAEYLTLAGYEVRLAANGEEAVNAARKYRPAFIVMDLSMPIIDGWEATRRIRAEEEGQRSYIIALSGFADRTSRTRAFEPGCDEILPKPFLPSDLASKLAALAKRSTSGNGDPRT